MVRRLLGDSEISPQTVMREAIERLGFSGDYLREKETRRRVRAGEHFFPTVASRLSLEMWQKAGKDELAVASEKVRELLAAADARGPVLPADTIAQLDTILTEAAVDAEARGLL
jgi:trimethylamine:corrinoid methyltransferase-like protein